MRLAVFVKRNGQLYRRRDGVVIATPVASFAFKCWCGREFPTGVEITTHLRWAERRPHEKHKRMP